MAKETEIERLVVRLVGDDKGYRDMMINASSMSKMFEEEAGRIANAQGKASKSLQEHAKVSKEAKRDIESLSGSMSTLGAAIGAVNPQAGAMVSHISNIISTMQQATSTAGSFSSALGGAFKFAAAHPLGLLAAGGAAAAGYFASQSILESRSRMTTGMDLYGRLESQVEMNRQMMWEDQTRKLGEIPDEPGKRSLMGSLSAEVDRDIKGSESMLASLNKQREALEKKMSWGVFGKDYWDSKYELENTTNPQIAEENKKYQAALGRKKEMESGMKGSEQIERLRQSGIDMSRMINLDQIIRDTKLSVEESNPLINRYTKEWHQLEMQVAKTQAQMDLAAHKFDVTKTDKEGRTVLDVDATMAKYRQALEKPEVDPKFKEEFEKWQEGDFANRIVRGNQEAEMSVLALQHRQEEMLDPLNKELRVRNAINEEVHKWQVENPDRAVPWEIAGNAQEKAGMAEQNRLVQEGAQLLIQYRQPMDRFIYDQKRLQQIYAEGGFGKGIEGLRAYQWALRDMAEQSHRIWYEMNTPKAMDAMQTGTWQSRQSLLEFRMGKTPIPLGELEERKRQNAQPAPNANPNAPFIGAANGIVEGYLKTLVDQNAGKTKFVLEPANIA